MSGGNGGPVIINSLIISGRFTPEECVTLRSIQDRSVVRCSWLDALRVAALVRKRLREP
jgi:hypothetical protein